MRATRSKRLLPRASLGAPISRSRPRHEAGKGQDRRQGFSTIARVALPTQTALKAMLHRAMRAQNLRKADLERRLGLHGPQVDRLLNPRHASRLDQIEGRACGGRKAAGRGCGGTA
jgi:hypothetical protein